MRQIVKEYTHQHAVDEIEELDKMIAELSGPGPLYGPEQNALGALRKTQMRAHYPVLDLRFLASSHPTPVDLPETGEVSVPRFCAVGLKERSVRFEGRMWTESDSLLGLALDRNNLGRVVVSRPLWEAFKPGRVAAGNGVRFRRRGAWNVTFTNSPVMVFPPAIRETLATGVGVPELDVFIISETTPEEWVGTVRPAGDPLVVGIAPDGEAYLLAIFDPTPMEKWASIEFRKD